VLFVLYNAESAQCRNGKQYLESLLKNACTGRSVLKIQLKISEVAWEWLMNIKT
jgi:hypothetical protein